MNKRAGKLILLLLFFCQILAAIPIQQVKGQNEYAVYFASYVSGAWSATALVDYVDGLNATRDTHDSKVFYAYQESMPQWQVFYWDETTNGIMHSASLDDGATWVAREEVIHFSVFPFFGGNMDVHYPDNDLNLVDRFGDQVELVGNFISSNGAASNFRTYNLTNDGTLDILGSSSLAAPIALGGSVVGALNNRTYMIYNSDDAGIGIHRDPANKDDEDSSHGVTPDFSTSTGGSQILQYNTSASFDLLSLAKNSTNHLAWSLVNLTTASAEWYYPHGDASQYLDELQSGFSSFCAASEAYDYGDSEICHLVYMKSSGELTYRKFENDAWSGATTLQASGASYPVINVDSSGNLLVVYVRNSVVSYMNYTGSWSSEGTLTNRLADSSTYTNPAYLSGSQYAHGGRIGLVWTAEYNAAPSTPDWTGIASPYAYSAIGLMSLSLIIGIAVSLIKTIETQDVTPMIAVVVVAVGIMIALFIALPLLNAFMGL